VQAASAAATVPVLLPVIYDPIVCLLSKFVYCILGFCSWCPRTKCKHQSVVITCRAFVWPGKPLAGHDSVAIPPTSPTSWLERWWWQPSSLWLAGVCELQHQLLLQRHAWACTATNPSCFFLFVIARELARGEGGRSTPPLNGRDTWFWVRV
jgi:hypothetical protein